MTEGEKKIWYSVFGAAYYDRLTKMGGPSRFGTYIERQAALEAQELARYAVIALRNCPEEVRRSSGDEACDVILELLK